MNERVIHETDACKGLYGHRCAQLERPFRRMHATDFWATDARKVWGKSRMRATYILDACNPSNRGRGAAGVNLQRDTSDNINEPCSGLICSARRDLL